MSQDIEQAVRTLMAEADAIRALSDGIDESFTNAVSIIHDMKKSEKGCGRLIVTGMGKSGHIARKIAATLASTGTPAFFVHPSEASHGDLGMVTESDAVLMISNSGESAELSDLIHYTRRYDIPMIAITKKADSALGKHADVTLILPDVPEACPNGLAPTTSTTMTLALGDALAVALLARSGLTPEQYKVFHPGGKLGQKLLTIAELMHKGDALPLVPMSATMGDAILMLTEKNLGCALIIDDDKNMAGIVTDGDLKRHMGPDLLQKPVTEIMSTAPKTISEKSLAVEALNIMTKIPGQYLTSLVVVDDNKKMSGLIRLQDCIQAGVA